MCAPDVLPLMGLAVAPACRRQTALLPVTPPPPQPTMRSMRWAMPLQRIPTPEDLAGTVMFLASGLARYITGEILNVNGGAVLSG